MENFVAKEKNRANWKEKRTENKPITYALDTPALLSLHRDGAGQDDELSVNANGGQASTFNA